MTSRHEPTLTWLAECSPEAVRRAIRAAMPALADARIDLHPSQPVSPLSRRAIAVVNGEPILKFAWSQPAAAALALEVRIIQALADRSLPVPRPLMVATEPLAANSESIA